MLHPQVIIHERDGRLAEQLRRLGEPPRRWALRQPRQFEPLWRFLRQGGPAVLIVKMSREPERELTLLERVNWQHPDVATVAVGDPENALTLGGLAWDMGVSLALFPPLSRDLLPEVVDGLMKRAIQSAFPAAGAVGETS